MCGIGTITLAKTASTTLPLDKAVSALALALDHRGGDATGVLALSADGRTEVQKATCDAQHFNSHRAPVPADTRAVAVHTRFATQGSEAFAKNNHPVTCGNAMVCHNGVIWESVPRRRNEPQVDTYVLAVAANDNAKRKKGETAQAHAERVALALADWDGSQAVAVAFRKLPFLVTARIDGSPLWQAEAEGVRVCASTRDAVVDTFDALDIALPVHTWQTETVKRKKGRKKVRTVTHTSPRVTSASEGDVFTWDSGTHTHGKVTLPEKYKAIHHSYRFDSGNGWYDPKTQGAATRTADTYGKIADNVLGRYHTAERCELCDTWQDGPLFRYSGMSICDDCERAVMPQPVTATDTEADHSV